MAGIHTNGEAMKTIVFGTLFLIGLTSGIYGTLLAQEQKSHLWMTDLAQKVDPYGNTNYTPIMISMVCSYADKAHTPPPGEIFITANGEYAHAEFDVDLLSGQLRLIGKPILPAPDFKCPAPH